jgi:hypothetical protein
MTEDETELIFRHPVPKRQSKAMKASSRE